jgi:hypothetical protein
MLKRLEQGRHFDRFRASAENGYDFHLHPHEIERRSKKTRAFIFYAAQARYGKLHNRCLMATDKAQSLFRIFKRALWQ